MHFSTKPGFHGKTLKTVIFRHFWPKVPQKPYGNCQNCQFLTVRCRNATTDRTGWQKCPKPLTKSHGKAENCRKFTVFMSKMSLSERSGLSVTFSCFLVFFGFLVKIHEKHHFLAKPIRKPEDLETVKTPLFSHFSTFSSKWPKTVKNVKNGHFRHFGEIWLSNTVNFWKTVSFDWSKSGH